MAKTTEMPLVALRAFVAVGRQGNFTRAAASLGITQGAVSRHVANLETFAGVRLFERRGASVTFTPAGSQVYDSVKDAMSTIELTIQLLAQRTTSHGRLKVRTSMPSFAMTVVIPALSAFTARHGMEIDLITSLAAPQPNDDFDVLITRDLTLPSTESWELLREELVCVGSPTLVASHGKQSRRGWPMVAARSRPDLIATWSVSHEIPPDRLQVVATYDHLFLAITAAASGTGFLVVPRLLVLDQLRNGTLEPLDPEGTPSGEIYVAYVSSQSRNVEGARALCRWLKGMLRKRV
jgi:DNA-binding transcriptional LysR family regulator